MAKVGLLFPGQGSQVVGMGQTLITGSSVAKQIYDQADQALGFNLSKIILEGPEEELKDTAVAQPAILTASIAAWEVLKQLWTPADMNDIICAGHSLGEYSALVAAEALSFEDAVKLVRKRGQLMQAAAAEADGSMTAIIGPSEEEVRAICEEADSNGQVQIANLNCPGQTVVSGSRAALAKVAEIAGSKGIKAMPLAVSGPFHSTFMQPAADQLGSALEETNLKATVYPVIANVSASPVKTPEEIKKSLIAQVAGSVRWTDSINYMVKEGVGTVVEIGPGKVLRGLMRKIDKTVKAISAFSSEEITKTAELLQAL